MFQSLLLASPYSFGDPTELERLFVDAGFSQVKVEQVSQEVHFKEMDRFVERQIKAAGGCHSDFRNDG